VRKGSKFPEQLNEPFPAFLQQNRDTEPEKIRKNVIYATGSPDPPLPTGKILANST
jgi:hypothetical protein